MSNNQNFSKDHIISELNKQREVQKELITRKAMLAEFVGIAHKDFDNVVIRLQDIDEKIKDLRSKL